MKLPYPIYVKSSAIGLTPIATGFRLSEAVLQNFREIISSRPFPRGNWGFVRIEGLVDMVSWTEPRDNRVTQIWRRL